MADENLFLLYAIRMGIFITFVYDLLRIWRRVLSHSRFWVSAEDLAFWCFCAIEVFLLMYRESNGTLRWFAVLGALAGMLVYKKTLSNPLVKYVSLALKKVLAILGKILGILLKPVFVVGRGIRKGIGKAGGALRSTGKKGAGGLKKRLTYLAKMLKMVISKK